MKQYQVLDVQFDTFEEVVAWAWNTHKIMFNDEKDTSGMTENEKQDACVGLSAALSGEEMMGA